MNNLPRQISQQGSTRIVNGISVQRDADVGIIFEKQSHLDLVSRKLGILKKDKIFYDGWDRTVNHYHLDNGAEIAMTYAQGPAYAASAVERLIRTGASHIVRIGTCGILNADVLPWVPIISTAAIRDEGTTTAYFPKEFPAIADMKLSLELQKKFNKNNIEAYLGITLTNGARYRESPEIMSEYCKSKNVLNIDMETSAIFIVSTLYGISATSIGIGMDSPVKKNMFSDNGSLASSFHGTTNHEDYKKNMNDRILLSVRCSLELITEITSRDYLLLNRHQNYDPDLKRILS